MEILRRNSALVFVIIRYQCVLISVCICVIFWFAYLQYCFISSKHSKHLLLLVLYAWCLRKICNVMLRCVYGLFFSKTCYITFAWYKILLLRHFWCRGHCSILMQLQILLPLVGDGYSIFLLCAFIIDYMFDRQQ